MRRYVPQGLTPVEQQVSTLQRREWIYRERCGVCLHRGERAFGVWTCGKGLRWPTSGICSGLSVEVS